MVVAKTMKTMKSPTSLRSLDKALDSTIERLNNKTESLLLSGFSQFDDKARPFEPGMYSIIAGRPSMGKTTWTRQVSVTLASVCNVLYFSMEESYDSFCMKMLCSIAKLSFFELQKRGPCDEEQELLDQARGELPLSSMYIDDDPGCNIEAIEHRIDFVKKKHGLDVVFIDYLQRIPVDNGNRNNSVGEVSRILKTIARRQEVAICVCSQLTRAAEGKCPTLADLRDSGNLEQDADFVGFIWSKKREETKRFFTIGKQRNGPSGEMLLDFNKDYGIFSEPE